MGRERWQRGPIIPRTTWLVGVGAALRYYLELEHNDGWMKRAEHHIDTVLADCGLEPVSTNQRATMVRYVLDVINRQQPLEDLRRQLEAEATEALANNTGGST